MEQKGWLKIPGIQDGERTLEEQMLGLQPALDEAPGKTVLDLGCAEGNIALEFARAGAKLVDGCDYNEPFIKIAQQQRKASGLRRVRFYHADLSPMMEEAKQLNPGKRYDIVLALAILHKIQDPEAAIRFCAQNANSLIVIRLPHGSVGSIRSKHGEHRRADLREVLPPLGFVRERKEMGPRGEWVQYWRRK
jgi:SAM-dependent methyltransferase